MSRLLPSLSALSLALLLAACDQPSESKEKITKTTQGSIASEQVDVDEVETANQPLSESEIAQLAKNYAGQALAVADVKEQQYKASSALVIHFSIPLQPEQKLSDFLVLSNKKTGRLEDSWELSSDLTKIIFRNLPPNQTLTLQVNQGLTAVNGQTLTEPYSIEFLTENLEPVVGFASSGSLLPSSLAEGLPIISLNVPEVEVEFFRVKSDKISSFINQWSGSRSLSPYQADPLRKSADLVYSGRFALDTQNNQREQSLLPTKQIEALQNPGLYFAVMRQMGDYSYTLPATLFSISDIGVSAHKSTDKYDIFAQNLNDGKALAKVSIQLLNNKSEVLQQTTSDENGHATLTYDERARTIVATQGDHTTVLTLTSSALDLAEFKVDGEEAGALQLFIFSARNLFRPGESAVFNFLLRDADGQLVADQPVVTKLIRPDGQQTQPETLSPVNPGFYQRKLHLSNNAPTGQWQLEAELGNGQKIYYKFHVEDFLPERMALRLEPIENNQQQNLQQVKVEGSYLYGAPAANNAVEARFSTTPLRNLFSQWRGFEFGVADAQGIDSKEIDSITLDDEGKGVLSYEIQLPDTTSPYQTELEVSLLESSGRALTRTLKQPLYPNTQLIGIRSVQGNTVDSDSEVPFEFIVTNQQGELQANDSLTVALFQENRDYYWTYSDSNGWSSQFNQSDLLAKQISLQVDATKPTQLSLPVKMGSYRLQVTDSKTQAQSSMRFWAGYRWQDDTSLRPDKITMTLDKTAYQAEDEVKVTLDAPHVGKGYLVLESSAGALWWQPIELKEKSQQFSLKLDPTWQRHDLYLNALLVRPGERKANLTPKRAVGLAHLPLFRSDRKLAISLQAPEKIRPETTLTVPVQVHQADGSPAQQASVLLSAVDEGVLSITQFKTANPFDGFYGRKAYGVDQYDIYHQLIDSSQGKLAKLRYGSDAESLGASSLRAVAKPVIVAEQSAVVNLDAAGRGTIELAIPNFNGQLRLVAHAWQADQFAAEETNTLVAAPIVTEFSGPRFIGSQDQSQVFLEFTNLTETEQQLDINLRTEGLIKLTDSAKLSVNLNPQQRQIIPITVEGLVGFGEAKLLAELTGLSIAQESSKPIQREWELNVRPPYAASTHQQLQLLPSQQAWQLPLNWLADKHLSGAQAELELSSTPPLNLKQQVIELVDYPYICAEQVVSRAAPSLFLPSNLLEQWLTPKQQKNYQNNLVDTVERLIGLQLHGGGFAMWNYEGQEQPWLSVYATDFLLQAQQQGVAISPDVLNNAQARLLRYLQESYLVDADYSDDRAHSRFATQAYAAYVLAKTQKAPLGNLRELMTRKADAVAAVPLLQLAVALREMGDEARAKEAIDLALQKKRPEVAWYGDYSSPVTELADTLALLKVLNVYPEERDRRLLALSQRLQQSTWLSTQEQAAVVRAAAVLGYDQSKQLWHAVLLDQDQSEIKQFAPAASQQRINLEQHAEALTLHNQSDTPLYALLNLAAYEQQAPQSVSQGLSIERQWFTPEGELLDQTQIRSGQRIVVHLAVRADKASIPDVLVEDLLPAGFELENQNLSESTASLSHVQGQLKTWLEQMENTPLDYQDFLDDRYAASFAIDAQQTIHLLYLARAVNPGQYQVPAPKASSMYRPEIRSIGSPSTPLEIQPR